MSVQRSTRKWLWISGLWVLALAGIATSFAEEQADRRPRLRTRVARCSTTATTTDTTIRGPWLSVR